MFRRMTGKTDNSRILLIGMMCLLVLVAACADKQGAQKPSNPNKVEQNGAKPQPEAPDQQAELEIKDVFAEVISINQQSKDDLITINIKLPQLTGLRNQKIQEEINRKLTDKTLSMKKDALKEAGEWAEEVKQAGGVYHPYEIAVDYEVRFNDNGILSITVEYYQYSGGAHGGTVIMPYNFDIQTGKELSLADLFPAGFDYQSIINREVSKEISTHPQDFFEGDEGFNGIGDQRPYYITAGNLVVHFSQYEIAPYSTGIPEFIIPSELFGKNIDQRLIEY